MLKTYFKQIYYHTRGEEQPSQIAFFDSADICCDPLKWGLIKSHLRNGRTVHLLSYRAQNQKFSQFIQDLQCEGTLVLHQLYKDPCGWLGNNITSASAWLDILKSKYSTDQGKIIVLVDDVHHALLTQSEEELLRNIRSLKQDDRLLQLILWCGRDILDESLCKSLAYICPCSVDIEATSPLRCKILFKKKSGKVIRSNEEFKLDSDLTLTGTKVVAAKVGSCSNAEEQNSSGGIESTFKLDLTEEEEVARRSVVLPHTRVQSGTIHYTPDSGDDWDDEDPDEDLEI